ncbi:MAG: hypothetical protein IJX28_07735 [Clostridia bacterium]|nr:hypothetical protein [Clostridia bacterium]
MREGTSGFWTEMKNGELSIGYEDYGVSQFGGGDFERTYRLDKDNTEKLIQALQREYTGSVEDMIEAAFGRNFSDSTFWAFCKTHGIEYSTSTWSG